MSDSKLTQKDRLVLESLNLAGSWPSQIAMRAGIRTMSPRETASRHCIKLTKLGLAEKIGKRSMPQWRITPEGIAALK